MRVDGDEPYSEEKLTGWFDLPAVVLPRGYVLERGLLWGKQVSKLILAVRGLHSPPSTCPNRGGAR